MRSRFVTKLQRMYGKAKHLIRIRDDAEGTGSHWTWDVEKLGKPIITVDLDHTITKKCGACDGGFIADGIQEHCVEVLRRLQERYRIIIFTGNYKYIRGSKPPALRTVEAIETFLIENDVPFDEISQEKPPACFMLDDRAIRHEGWLSDERKIKRREKMK